MADTVDNSGVETMLHTVTLTDGEVTEHPTHTEATVDGVDMEVATSGDTEDLVRLPEARREVDLVAAVPDEAVELVLVGDKDKSPIKHLNSSLVLTSSKFSELQLQLQKYFCKTKMH